MIKKIKDLTLEETHEICTKNVCALCPLSIGLGDKLCMRDIIQALESEVYVK